MGAFTNGVYVPVIGETGWGDEVNDFLTRSGEQWVNVKAAPYGAVADGVTDDSAAFVAAIGAVSATRGVVFLPPANYKLATAVPVPAWVKIMGPGMNQVNINYTNTHAFTCAASTGHQHFENLTLTSLAGSTSGSAIKVTAGTQVFLRNITVNSVATNLDPAIWFLGAVDCHVDHALVAGGAGAGIKLEIGAFFANANSISRSRVASITGTTTAAIYVEGTQNRIRDCVMESDAGYGVQAVNANVLTLEGCWFEAIGNHYVYASDGTENLITRCNFAQSGGLSVGGARYIKLTNTLGSGHIEHHGIVSNSVVDPAATNIDIGANVEDTVILHNRNLTNSTVTDGGTRTVQFQNRDSSNVLSDVFPNVFKPALRIKGTTEAGGSSDLQATALFAVSDLNGSSGEEFGVARTGFTVIHTPNGAGAVSASDMPTHSMSLYWDNAASQVKAFVRKGDGSTATVVLG